MNVDKFAGAFEQALLNSKPEPQCLPGEIYDHSKSLGMDMTGYERSPTPDEIRRALNIERVRGEYLRTKMPAPGKKSKPYKAERKSRLLALQRAALVKA